MCTYFNAHLWNKDFLFTTTTKAGKSVFREGGWKHPVRIYSGKTNWVAGEGNSSFPPLYPFLSPWETVSLCNQGNLHFWALIGIHECVGKEETFSRAEPGVMWAGPPITQATRESNIQGTWGRQWSCWDKCQRLGSIVLAFMLSRGRCILFKKT